MHGVIAINDHFESYNSTVPVTELTAGQIVQITEWYDYRDADTDQLMSDEQSWIGQVSDVEFVWNAPSEVFVSFTDGPGAWVLRDAKIPLVSGPLNRYGRF